MAEFTIKSESVDVERIMEQIRSRIREKRDEDYTEQQVRELATAKLERFLDPKNVRSDLVEHYKKLRAARKDAFTPPDSLLAAPSAPPAFEFDYDTIYRSSRGPAGRVLYWIRRALNPVLKFFFNPTPIVHALAVQREINERQTEAINWMVKTQADFIDRLINLYDLSGSRLAAREEIDSLSYEVLNNLVVEMTRLSIDMKNHRMRVESIAGRLDFDERRARALEQVVQYREGLAATTRALTDTREKDSDSDAGSSDRPRRRRRRGRRRSPTARTSAARNDQDTADGATAPTDESADASAAAANTPPADAPPASRGVDEASPDTLSRGRSSAEPQAEKPPAAPDTDTTET